MRGVAFHGFAFLRNRGFSPLPRPATRVHGLRTPQVARGGASHAYTRAAVSGSTDQDEGGIGGPAAHEIRAVALARVRHERPA